MKGAGSFGRWPTLLLDRSDAQPTSGRAADSRRSAGWQSSSGGPAGESG